MNRILLISITLSLLLGGCAAPRKIKWTSFGTPAISLDTAKAKCDYETSAATQSTDYGYKSLFGQELDRAMRKGKLMEKCMYAQNYTEE